MIDLKKGWEISQDFVGFVTEELMRFFAKKNVNEINFDLGTRNDLFDTNINVDAIGVDMEKIGDGIGCGYDVIGLSFFYIKDTKGTKYFLSELSHGDILLILGTVIDYELYLTEDRRTMDQTIHFDNESVLITDPTYFLKHGDLPFNDVNFEDYDLISKNGWDRYNLTLQQASDYISSMKVYNDLSRKLYDEWRMNQDILVAEFGRTLNLLGFNHYMAREVGMHNWKNNVFEDGTNKNIGKFSVDMGMVCVISLKQVLEYNPKFANELKESPYIATVLDNFTGDITYKANPIKMSDGDIDNNGYLVGKGSINFRTEQIGC